MADPRRDRGVVTGTSRHGMRPALFAALAAIAIQLVAFDRGVAEERRVEPAAAQRGATVKLPSRGVVRARNQATISTELAARVATIGFREGQHFKKGDLLIGFDCRRHEAELASAEAVKREMQVGVDSNAFLEKRNAASKQDLEVAKARADKAAAEVEALRVRLDQCRIVAPFDGRVNELAINEHEMSVAGKPLVQILASDDYEIDLILPSDWLVWLKVGEEFEFTIDETHRVYAGLVTRMGAAVDTTSQTIKITGRFKATDETVLPGMSGLAHFARAKG